MNDHQAAIEPGFYDHELDSALGEERRAPDWGADEVFASTPRRRFRRAHRPAEGESWMTRSDELALARIRQASERRPAHPRAAAPPADLAPTTRQPASAAPDALHADDPAVAPAPQALAAAAPERPPGAGPAIEGPGIGDAPAGRRTIVVTGRPGGDIAGRAARPDRRRPPRTVGERVAGRPDRIAAWAFGMGLALILVAVSTADAAPL